MLCRALRRLIVGFLASKGPQSIVDYIGKVDNNMKRVYFDVRNAETLQEDICGWRLTLGIERDNIYEPWRLVCIWVMDDEDEDAEDPQFIIKTSCKIENNKIPNILSLAPRSINILPPLVVRRHQQNRCEPMLSVEYF